MCSEQTQYELRNRFFIDEPTYEHKTISNNKIKINTSCQITKKQHKMADYILNIEKNIRFDSF